MNSPLWWVHRRERERLLLSMSAFEMRHANTAIDRTIASYSPQPSMYCYARHSAKPFIIVSILIPVSRGTLCPFCLLPAISEVECTLWCSLPPLISLVGEIIMRWIALYHNAQQNWFSLQANEYQRNFQNVI